MKKIFSIVAAAAIMLSFASCDPNGGGAVDQNGFKITVDSIEAASAHVNVTPADTTMYYGALLFKTEDIAKKDTLDANLAQYAEQLSAYVQRYGIDVLVQYGLINQGVYDETFTGIPSATELTFVAFEIKYSNDSLSVGKYATVKFRTKELKPEKTVALNVTAADYEYYADYGLVQLQLEDTQAGLVMGLVLEVENMNGTFNEENFYEDGVYVYNYVEWGDGDDDWTPLMKLQMTGSLNETTGVYAVEGSAIGENMVEYTFKANATDVEANAPAKVGKKAFAASEFNFTKAVNFIKK